MNNLPVSTILLLLVVLVDGWWWDKRRTDTIKITLQARCTKLHPGATYKIKARAVERDFFGHDHGPWVRKTCYEKNCTVELEHKDDGDGPIDKTYEMFVEVHHTCKQHLSNGVSGAYLPNKFIITGSGDKFDELYIGRYHHYTIEALLDQKDDKTRFLGRK